MLSLLLQLSPSKATEIDGFLAKILKIAAPHVTQSLTRIFNQSQLSRIFPDDWKTVKVIPIYKSGLRSDMNNYRPMPVISIIAKLEKLVHNQVYEY